MSQLQVVRKRRDPGQYSDAETGWQYLRARYYDPAIGRFLTRDPLESITGSPYGYVDGDPLNDTDPLGLFCLVHNNHGGCKGAGVLKEAVKVAASKTRGFVEGLVTTGTIIVVVGAVAGCAASVVCAALVGAGVGAVFGAGWAAANYVWDNKCGSIARDLEKGAISGGLTGALAGGTLAKLQEAMGPAKFGWEMFQRWRSGLD